MNFKNLQMLFATLNAKLILVVICLFSFGNPVFAQQTTQTKTPETKETIKSQFEITVGKASNWTDRRGRPYKIIRTNLLNELKKQTLDSLKALQSKNDDASNVIKQQEEQITKLKLNLNNTQAILDETNSKTDSINVFGTQLSKTSYNVLMWAIISLLFILLFIFIFKYRNSNIITKSVKKSLIEIEENFEAHRRNALEREQKVRRQLQDEINKQKGI